MASVTAIMLRWVYEHSTYTHLFPPPCNLMQLLQEHLVRISRRRVSMPISAADGELQLGDEVPTNPSVRRRPLHLPSKWK